MNLDYFRLACNWKLQRVERTRMERQFRNFTGRIWVVELHIPYTRYEYLEQVITGAVAWKLQHRQPIIIVLNGDNVNLDIFSRFYRKETGERSDQSNPLEELRTLERLLARMSSTFDRVIFTQSNHDRRLERLILQVMSERAISEAVISRLRTIKQFCESERLRNVVHVPGVFFQVGDLLTCHFENNLMAPGSTGRKITKAVIGKLDPSVNVIMQSHTHYQSRMTILRRLVIETGALCEIQDYARGEKIMGEEKTITIGYAYCEMRNGTADWNATDFHVCELEGYW